MVKNFLSFVEIQTKLATFLPFCVALAFVFFSTGGINVVSTLLYIVAALFLDMSVTAINNHLDAREEKTKPHYSNVVGVIIILAMLIVSALVGVYLVYLHGFTLLVAGMFCFFIGIIYTFGPMPISKSTYGEFFSGFVVGPVVMFIVVTINHPYFNPLGLGFDLTYLRFSMDIDLVALALFGIVTVPTAFGASSILLANNICDREKDRAYRYTLVHSIGLKNSLRLFRAFYYGAYVAIVLGVVLRQLPITALVTLVTIIPVQKNINIFLAKQVKAETFVISVKNFMVIMVVYALSIAIGGLF